MPRIVILGDACLLDNATGKLNKDLLQHLKDGIENKTYDAVAVMSNQTVRDLLRYVLKNGEAKNDVWKKQLLSAILQDLRNELKYPVSLSLP